jgi:cyclohexadieny/prephenate dehydrogenase
MTQAPSEPLVDTLCIVGPGLIGSSVLRAARADGLIARHTIATDIDPAVCARVRELGIADEVDTDPSKAVADADVVMLCVPVGAIAPVARALYPHLKPGAIMTDTGSVKRSVLADLDGALPPGAAYVPAHPMAGTEHSGPDAGFATLFVDRWCLLTPRADTPPDATARIVALWERLGARTRIMDPEHHDNVCAMVSHLPHLIAFTICGTADQLAEDTRGEVLDYAASGFRDFTRVAASDPVMWRDIFLHNREALLAMLDRFRADADAMAEAIRHGDADRIVETIRRGREIRRSLIENRQA